MTATELVAGRELDVAIAERVMGYRWVPSRFNTEQLLLAPPGMTDEAVNKSAKLGGSVTRLSPEYSTDIAAAWQAVEHLRTVFGCMLDLRVYVNGAEARFVTLETKHGVRRLNSGWWGAETAPAAICRAALAAVSA